MTYTIDLLPLGWFPDVPENEHFWMTQLPASGPRDPMALFALLIRSEGATVLVNTGPALDPFLRPGQHLLEMSEDDRIDRRLAALGVAMDDIEHVIITPMESYTLGGIDQFPNAEIHINREGWADVFAPRYKHPSNDALHNCLTPHQIDYLFNRAWDRVDLMRHEVCILPGIDVFWVGGHRPSSIAVKVETREGVAIYSDCMFRYENIHENRVLGINENMYEVLDAYERIRSEADILLPMYDPQVLELHPQGRLG